MLEACFAEASPDDSTHAAAIAVANPAALGEVFGDYELLEEIGRGGMGVVYRARQRSLARTVALKMMLPVRGCNRESVRRFRMEAEAASRLRHPGIVSIHEVGECEGQHFYSMDYIEGKDLVQRVRDGLPSPEWAARWTRAVAEAIHHAHQHGILHRDLKPANVLIDARDEAHVTDFGLAKLLDDGRDLTAPGRIMGTPSFMPPEQADSCGGPATVASDVYGLGAVFYFLLTGQAPFQGASTEQTLRLLLTEDPVAPSRRRPGLPRDLETICLKCLCKEPSRRYGSAAALADDLGAWSRREPIRARPTPPVERLWFWARRNPALASLSALLVAAVVGGAALQQRALSQARRATAAAEGLVQYMNQDLTELLRPLGRLGLLDNVNRTVQRYYQGLPMNEQMSGPAAGQAQFYLNNAAVLRELGKVDEAQESARAAISLLGPLVRKTPANFEWTSTLAMAHGELRNILANADPTGALEHAQQAVRFARQARELTPKADSSLDTLANAHLELASVLQRQGKLAQAENEIQAAATLLSTPLSGGGDATARQSQLALCSYYQGVLEFDHGRREKARQRFDDYLKRTRQLAKNGSDSRVLHNLAIAHSHLGRAILNMGDNAGALQQFKEYHRVAEQLERQDPGNVNYRRELGFSCEWLAAAMEQNGGAAQEIDRLLSRSFEIFERLATDFPQGDVWQDHAVRVVTRLAEWRQTHQDSESARQLLADETRRRWDLLVVASGHPANHRRFINALDWSEAVGAPQGAAVSERRARLQRWVADADAQAAQAGANPDWDHTHAQLSKRLASAFVAEEDLPGARKAFEAALSLLQQVAAERPEDAELAGEVAQTFASISLVNVRAGATREAADSVNKFEQWLHAQQGAPGPKVLQALDKAVALHAKLSSSSQSWSPEERAKVEKFSRTIQGLQAQAASRSSAP